MTPDTLSLPDLSTPSSPEPPTSLPEVKHVVRSLPQPLNKHAKNERSQPVAHQLLTLQKDGNEAINLLLAVQTEVLQVREGATRP